MTDIIKRIDELISICRSDREHGNSYNSIIFEINNLILELAGRKSELYVNFSQVANNKKINAGMKQEIFIGILNGLKNGLKIHMNVRKYQIFVSSTYKDLSKYRKTVSDEITFRGHFPAGMEDFTACGEDLEKYIKRVIDESDYYVLIIGQRFGSSIPADENVSYTMMEYEYAKLKGMRIIPLIYNGKTTLPESDLDVNKEKFDAFVSQITKTVPQYFKNENELIRKLTKALEAEIKNHPQKGWFRL